MSKPCKGSGCMRRSPKHGTVCSLPAQDIKGALEAIISLKDLTNQSRRNGLPMNLGTTSN